METVTFFVRALRLKTTKVRKVGKTEFRKYVSNLIFNLLKKQKKERAERSFFHRYKKISIFYKGFITACAHEVIAISRGFYTYQPPFVVGVCL